MKTVAVLPTYEEAGAIADILRRLRALSGEGLPPEVVVADDDSPDGTAAIAAEVGRETGGVFVLVRTHDKGRGRAGREGFLAALARGADLVVEMDADGSHPPEEIPRLLAPILAGRADLVLGSRRVPGGGEEGEGGVHRRLLTGAAAAFVRCVLGVPVRDPTTGFRAYSRAALAAIEPETLSAKGPEIVEEVLVRAVRAGLRIEEVPFVFRKRAAGRSKLDARRLLSVLRAVWGMRG